MAIRNPDPSIDIPHIEDIDMTSAIQWHSLKCRLVTPMYGGGVTSTVVDTDMPIRVTGIRGQLRFWWRLLAKQKWYNDLTPKQIREKEFDLWGGMNEGDEDGKASKVLLRVKDVRKINIENWAEYKANAKGKEILKPKDWANTPYALFPAQGRTQENPDEEPHALLKDGCSWTLEIAFDNRITNNQIDQVWESIRWWTSFGGVGSRTRRGLGAFTIEKTDKVYPISFDKIDELGFNFKAKNASNATQAWTSAITKLQKFRQIGEGRNNYSSRSHWSEPDAIRDITGQSSSDHSQRKTQGNYFPRGSFGLPIIFKFKGEGTRPHDEPMPTTLTVKYKGQDFERLASPLILRPYCDEKGKWYSLALCLPSRLDLDNDIQLKLTGNGVDENVDYWLENKGKELTPIKNNLPNGEVNPLTAFLTYFAK